MENTFVQAHCSFPSDSVYENGSGPMLRQERAFGAETSPQAESTGEKEGLGEREIEGKEMQRRGGSDTAV